ncbi:MAG: hypothetical protein AAFV53_32015 [Myxococcota bacterium]
MSVTPDEFLSTFQPEYSFQRREGWLTFCERMAESGADPAGWELRIAAVWSDEERVVPGPWLESIFAGAPPAALPMTRTISFGEASVYQQEHGNRLLPLEDAHVHALADCSLLSGITGIHMATRSYQIRGTHVQILADSPYLQGIQRFHVLRLPGSIGLDGAQAIARSKNFSGLETLDLYYNNIEDSGLIALLESDNVRNLRYLRVARDKIRVAGIKALAQCARLSNLEHLILDDNNLSSGAFIELARSPHLRKLKTLHLKDNKPKNKGIVALASSPILATVEELALRTCSIGNEGIIAMAKSPHLGRLRKVDFGINDWGAPGAVALADAASMGPALEELDLYAITVGAAGGVALATSSKLSALKQVKLKAYDPSLDISACEALLAWAPLGEDEKRTIRRRLEKLQQAITLRESKRDVDISRIRAKLKKAAEMEPSEKTWDRVCFFLDEAHKKNPIQAEEAVIDEAEALLAGWPDALRRAQRPWLYALKDEGVHLPMLRLVRCIAHASCHDLSPIAGCSALRNLRTLRVYGGSQSLEEEDAIVMASAAHFSNLHTLELDYIKNLNRAAPHLAAAPWLSSLRRLTFDRNGLTSAGLGALLKSPHLTGLVELTIRNNRIGDSGAAALAKCAALKSLKTLTIQDVGVTAKGRSALAASPHLSAAIKATFQD